MDIVWKGRGTGVEASFRAIAEEKLARLSRLDHKLIRIEVERAREHNPRLTALSERVTLTCLSRGPVLRAEAAAEEAIAALDLALDKLENQMRRNADRRRVHHGSRTPLSVGAAVGSPGTGEQRPDERSPRLETAGRLDPPDATDTGLRPAAAP